LMKMSNQSDNNGDSANAEKNEYWRGDVTKIRDDSIHGSGYLANQALDVVEDFIKRDMYRNRTELLQSLSKLSNAIVRAKPLMALIFNRTHKVIDFIQDIPKEEKNILVIKKAAVNEIRNLRKEADDKIERITKLGSRMILDNHLVLVHSYSNIVYSILVEARKLKRRFRVISTESRPNYEGSQMAIQLAKSGIKTQLITDSDVTRAVNDAHFILTGTDRITETAFINKTGTHTMAVLANSMNKPLYVAGETDKILLKRTYPVRFLQSDPTEILKEKHGNLTVSNIYFEETPLSYVSKIIIEDGIFELKEFIDRYL
jgi:translation initiation factor 2B subunit (eIF-2B alpha/beta/delta family)